MVLPDKSKCYELYSKLPIDVEVGTENYRSGLSTS